jgi:hypothetical protein
MTGKGAMGTHFTSQDLIEFSFVPVPSNPGALVARDGFNNNEIKSMKKEMRRWIKEADALCSCPVEEKALGASEDSTGGALVPSGNQEQEGDSKMKKGAISYKDAHPDGTPKAEPDEPWSAAAERAKCQKAAHLKAVHAGFTGGDDSDKGNFILPHHGGEPPHPVHLKAVKTIAKKFTSSKKAAANMQYGDEWDFTQNDNQVIMDHVAQHLNEFKEPIPWDVSTDDKPGAAKDASDVEVKSITDSDKSSLQAGINKENLQDLSAYHRRMHMFAAQGNMMTGFSQADMNWLHAAIESAMCKAHKAQDPPTDCAPASPLEWKKSVKAAKPKPDEDDEEDGKEEDGDEEEKCSHITDVTGAIAERENSKKSEKAEAGEDDKEDEDEEEEPVTPEKPEKPTEKKAAEDGHVTKIGRALSKANEAALNEALGKFSEGFGQHDKGLQFHEKVTKAHAKALDAHEEAMKCYQAGADKLKSVLKAMGDKPDEGSEAEEENETPEEEAEEQGKPQQKAPVAEPVEKAEPEDEVIAVDPDMLAEELTEFFKQIRKEFELS